MVKRPKFRPKFCNFGDPWGHRAQNGRLCPGPICTIMQNFTPIGATVAKIYLTGQRKNIETNIPFHTLLHSVWLVIKATRELIVNNAVAHRHADQHHISDVAMWQ